MKIGIIDSGIGGFSILHTLKSELPQHDYIYLADQLHFPYSERSIDSLRELGVELVQTLLDQGCTTIVIACNTLTIHALEYLRQVFPNTPFVGTVPAVKSAHEQLPAGSHVVVLATENTARSVYLRQLIQDLNHVHFTLLGTTELVQAIEAGDHDWITKVLRNLLLGAEQNSHIDAIVIGCTHFSFAENNICRILPHATLFDSRVGVLKQLKRSIKEDQATSIHGTTQLLSTLPNQESVLEYMYTRMTSLLHLHTASAPFSCRYIAGNI